MHEFLLNVKHWHFIPFNTQKYEWQNFDIIFVIFSELLDSRQAWKYFSNFSYFSSFLLSELNNSFVIMTFLTLLIYFFSFFPLKNISSRSWITKYNTVTVFCTFIFCCWFVVDTQYDISRDGFILKPRNCLRPLKGQFLRTIDL